MLRVHESLRGKHLFVTGASGFVGKVWIAMLLSRVPDIGQITLLLRGKAREDVDARFRRIALRSPAFRALREQHGDGFPAFLRERVTVVKGSLTTEGFGLPDPVYRKLLAPVDAVIHFAGVTDFDPDPPAALAVNIDGTTFAADAAAQSQGRLLLHISTAFVAGNVSGEIAEEVRTGIAPNGHPFDPEAEVEAFRSIAALEDRAERRRRGTERAQALGYPNLYTYTKGLAEHRVAARSDIRWGIHRPAIVESAREYPFPGWNEGINTSGPLVWLLSTWFRKLPASPNHHFNVVPVDTVARAISVHLAALLAGRTVPVTQCASADVNPFHFDRAIELTSLAVRRMHSRPEATPLARGVLKHLDSVARPADIDPFPSLPFLRKTLRSAGDGLAFVKPADYLPGPLRDAFGAQANQWSKKVTSKLRDAERNLGRVERMLELFQPFTHDNDYIFQTDVLRSLSDELSEDEKVLFGFDLATLDWRHYWLEVQVPGLEKWSLPLLRREAIEEDSEPAWGHSLPPSMIPADLHDGNGASNGGPGASQGNGSREEPTPRIPAEARVPTEARVPAEARTEDPVADGGAHP
ncbi:MAG: SDR family oxidoreductase [Myxococcales bacterium]|nr:SDR family oxidoreductase [Myxococcales bacterium]